MILTAFVLTFVVFYLTNLPPNLEKLARSEGSVRMTDEAVAQWIIDNGHGGSILGRYGQWLGVVPGWQNVDEKGVTRGRCFAAGTDPAVAPRYCGVLQGDWGYSTFFRGPVLPNLGEKLAATGMADAVGDDRDGAKRADHRRRRRDARRQPDRPRALDLLDRHARPRRNMSRVSSSSPSSPRRSPACRRFWPNGAGSTARSCSRARPRRTTSPSGTSPCR